MEKSIVKWTSLGIIGCLFVLTLLSGCSMARMGALSKAREAMGKGECAKAIKKAGDADNYGTPSPKQQAEILFIRASCADRMGNAADAVGLFRFLKEHYPETIYGYQAIERLRAIEEDRGGSKAED